MKAYDAVITARGGFSEGPTLGSNRANFSLLTTDVAARSVRRGWIC